MASNFNFVVLVGNLTQEPTLNYTTSGVPVANLSLAVNNKRGNKEEVLFISCVVFNKLADVVVKYCPKGKSVLVAGRLVQEQWQNSEGQKRSQIKLYVNQLQLLGSAPSTIRNEQSTETNKESEDF